MRPAESPLSTAKTARGRVIEAKAERSSGFKKLHAAALKSNACKLKPVAKDGKTEQAWGTME
jgi:hypothetical protein